MATYYIDPVSGSDANAGTDLTLPRKTRPATLAAGDYVKFKASPSATLVAGSCVATWNDLSLNVPVTWTTPQIVVIDDDTLAWVAVSGKSASPVNDTVNYKKPTIPRQSPRITRSASAANGKQTYKTLASTLDLSAYQQVSLWIRFSAITVSDYSIALCSDTTGDVVVNSLPLPDTSNAANGWFNLTLNYGANLGSSIRSIAIYSASAQGTGTVLINTNNIIACKNSADALTLSSLIGKGTTGETWYAIQYISDVSSSGCTLWIDGLAGTTGTSGVGGSTRGYSAQTSGLNETLSLRKRECITNAQMGVSSVNTTYALSFNGGLPGTLASPIVLEGGYSNFSLSAPDGETWFDGQCGVSNCIISNSTYTSFKKFAAVRYSTGFAIAAGNGAAINQYEIVAANHCTIGVLAGESPGSVYKLGFLNNNATALNTSSNADCTYYLGQVNSNTQNNNGLAFVTGNRLQFLPLGSRWQARNNGINNTQVGVFGGTAGGDNIFRNGDFTASYYLMSGAIAGLGVHTFIDCTFSISVSLIALNRAGANNKLVFINYNGVPGDNRILYDANNMYLKEANTIRCVVARIPSLPSSLRLSRLAVTAGKTMTVTAQVSRTGTAAMSQLAIEDSLGNRLAASNLTAATANTYEPLTLTYTPAGTGMVSLVWYNWTAGSQYNITIKDLVIKGLASATAFKDFGIFDFGMPAQPNASSGVSAQIGSAFIPLFEIPMQAIKPGQTAYFEFPVQDSAGAAATPDAVSVKFRRNNTQDVAVTPTITTGSGFGLGSVVVPSGYALGDQLSVEIQATVGGVTGAWTPVWRGKVTDVANEVWGAGTRTLSNFGFTVNTVANATETAIKAKTDLIGDSVATAADLHVTVNGGYTTGDRTRDDQTNDLIVERLTLPDYPDGPLLVLPAPSTPENTIIYGYTRDFGQASVAGVTVKLKHITKKIAVGNGFPVEYEAETQSDEDGFWSLECPISSDIKPTTVGATQSLTIDEVTYNIRVPAGGGNAVDMIR